MEKYDWPPPWIAGLDDMQSNATLASNHVTLHLMLCNRHLIDLKIVHVASLRLTLALSDLSFKPARKKAPRIQLTSKSYRYLRSYATTVFLKNVGT